LIKVFARVKEQFGFYLSLAPCFSTWYRGREKGPSRFILLLVAHVRAGPLLLTVALEYPKIVHALLSCLCS